MVLVTCKASPGSKDHDCPGGINVFRLLESHPTTAVPRLVIDGICCGGGGGGGGKSLPGQPLAPLPPSELLPTPYPAGKGLYKNQSHDRPRVSAPLFTEPLGL